MKVVIVGAGSQAMTVAEIIRQNRVFEVIGCIDRKESGKTVAGVRVIGDHSLLKDILAQGINNAIIAIGDNAVREKYYLKLKGMGFNFVNALHPSAIIAESVAIGEGLTVEAGAILEGGITIGNNVIISAGCVLGRNVELGHNVFIGPGTTITGNNVIRKNAAIGSGVTVAGGITVGKNAVVPAGKAVHRPVPDRGLRANG